MTTTDLSLEHQVALLDDDEREQILADLDLATLEHDWSWNGRPSQILPIWPGEPGSDFSVALALAGRGWGKSLAGAQWVRAMDAAWSSLGRDNSRLRVALLGRTSADVRDVMLEGPSGLLNIWPPSVRDRVHWYPSRRRLDLPNGGMCTVFSAEEPAQLRGPQFHLGWCLPEGTMIRTAGGQLPIEMLEVGDRVWTRAGLRPIEAVAMTGMRALLRLSAEDGRELRASAEHGVLTARGWLPMQFVVPGDIIYAWTNRFQAPPPSTNGPGSSGTATPRTATTATQAEGCSCMSPSGFGITGEYPRGTSSTTLTTTGATTLSPIWKPERLATTRSITRETGFRTTQAGPSRLHPKHPALGPTPCGPRENPIRSSASGAARSSRPQACGHASAAQPALLPLVVALVESCSETARTYDIGVAGQPEYFADDVLVHNSDELATYKQVRSSEDDATAWENLRIAVRLGSRPQILATTTPKRVPVLRTLLAEHQKDHRKILIRRGRTRDNRYLSGAYLDVLEGLYGGTALGRQELEGEMLDDVAGATTSEAIIDKYRITKLPPNMPWIKVVSVDPTVAERPHDECGIVVLYITRTWPVLHRHAVVVDDLSGHYSPTEWGDIALKAAHEHGATVIAEVNQGGNLVFQMLRQAAQHAGLPMPQMKEVWSSKSKAVRAEPVSGAYARGRVHHLNVLAELESQLTSWVYGSAGYSPDRMDSAVQGIAAGLFPESVTSGMPGSTVLRTVADEHIRYTNQTSMVPAGRGWR